MPVRVYLMRHGEVANGSEKRYNGHIDVDITDNGVRQMHRLAGLLTGKVLSAIYSSDLIRSVKGARIIADQAGLTPTSLEVLRERSVGAWEGLTADEIRERFPEEYRMWRADLINYRPPGGECLLDVKNRILPAYKRIVGSNSDRSIALMLHGGVNRIILADALGMEMTNLFRIDQAFGALNIIDYFEDGMAVVRLVNG
jgi:alpha-ribazole phosphatase